MTNTSNNQNEGFRWDGPTIEGKDFLVKPASVYIKEWYPQLFQTKEEAVKWGKENAHMLSTFYNIEPEELLGFEVGSHTRAEGEFVFVAKQEEDMLSLFLTHEESESAPYEYCKALYGADSGIAEEDTLVEVEYVQPIEEIKY